MTMTLPLTRMFLLASLPLVQPLQHGSLLLLLTIILATRGHPFYGMASNPVLA